MDLGGGERGNGLRGRPVDRAAQPAAPQPGFRDEVAGAEQGRTREAADSLVERDVERVGKRRDLGQPAMLGVGQRVNSGLRGQAGSP